MRRAVLRGLYDGLAIDLIACLAISSVYLFGSFPPDAIGKENFIAAVFMYGFPYLSLPCILPAILVSVLLHKVELSKM